MDDDRKKKKVIIKPDPDIGDIIIKSMDEKSIKKIKINLTEKEQE